VDILFLAFDRVFLLLTLALVRRLRGLGAQKMTWAYALSGAIALRSSSTWWLHCFEPRTCDVHPGLVHAAAVLGVLAAVSYPSPFT